MYLISLSLPRLGSLKNMTKISEAGFKLAKWKTITIPKRKKNITLSKIFFSKLLAMLDPKWDKIFNFKPTSIFINQQ